MIDNKEEIFKKKRTARGRARKNARKGFNLYGCKVAQAVKTARTRRQMQ